MYQGTVDTRNGKASPYIPTIQLLQLVLNVNINFSLAFSWCQLH